MLDINTAVFKHSVSFLAYGFHAGLPRKESRTSPRIDLSAWLTFMEMTETRHCQSVAVCSCMVDHQLSVMGRNSIKTLRIRL